MGRLLATVSHELNNPLQAIQNALFLLKEENVFTPQARQDLEIVLAESKRMASMIEHLRATYRPIQADDFAHTDQPPDRRCVRPDLHSPASQPDRF